MKAFSRLTVTAAVLAAAILPPVCVPAGASVKRDVNDLKQKSYQSQKDISDNKKEIAALRAELQKLKASIPREQSMESLRKSQTTLLNRVNDLHEEVQGLMGQVERELNESRKISLQTAADLDVVKASGGGTAAIEKRLKALELELALIKKRLEARGYSSVIPPAGEDVETASPARGSAENQYKEAYDLYKGKKYPKAREAFERFIKKNKGHKWAGNAQFWIGETYYAEKTYDRAILSYDDVVRKYPKSNKVPDAMLKQGYAFIKLKDPLAAKGVLRSVVQKYPDSRAAGHAREKLKSLH
jgi:tol-pal system protein YbgF